MNPKASETSLRSLISPVQLGKSDQVLGTVFRKQIVSYGEWLNPDYWWDDDIIMELDEAFADSLIENFNNKVFGKRISVPRNHTGNVDQNAGEVIKLEKGEGGLWAYLDIRDPETVDKINNGLIFDVSIGFDWDYVDQKSMKKFGPTLIHVALVTDPYLNDMDDFRKADIESLSRRFNEFSANTGFGKTERSIIMLSKYKVEELKRMKFAKVKNDKEYDVPVKYTDTEGKEVEATVKAGEEIEVPENQETTVTEQVTNATDPSDADDDNTDDVDEDEEVDEKDKLEESEKEELARLRKERSDFEATSTYDKLLSKGKITPAQKDLFLSLGGVARVKLSKEVKGIKLSKDSTTSAVALFSAILNAGPAYVKFGEKGGNKDKEGITAELSKEQEDYIKSKGFSVETFKKQLAAGTISLDDLEEK